MKEIEWLKESIKEGFTKHNFLKYLTFIIWIFTILAVFDVYGVNAQEVYNQTYSFNGGGQNSQVVGNGASYNTVSGLTIKGDLENLYNNFNNEKYITNITIPNVVYVSTDRTYTLDSSVTGINQQYTSFTSTVLGTNYGSGYLGWERTTGNNYNYVIYFDNINTGYASTLTGNQEIVLTFNHSLYSHFTVTGTNDCGYSNPSYSYVNVNIVWYEASCGGTGYKKVSVKGTETVKFTFTDSSTLSVNNVSSSFAYINLTKYSTNQRLLITNINSNTLYDITSTSDVSQLFNIMNGVITKVYDVVSGIWVNNTIYYNGGSLNIPSTTPAGNINTSKSSYNQSENLYMLFNLSNVNVGRIVLGNVANGDNNKLFAVTSGLNQNLSFYIPNDALIGQWIADLEYYDGTQWQSLGYILFIVNPINNGSFINIVESSYDLGQLILIDTISNSTGYYILNDSNGNIKMNYTIKYTTTFNESGYYLSQNDLTGIWTANLYNSTGTLLSSDTTYINFGVITPTITTPTPDITDVSIISIGAVFGKASIGILDTDNNGDIQDTIHNKNIGMNVLYTLVFLVLLIFVIGTYHKITRKR